MRSLPVVQLDVIVSGAPGVTDRLVRFQGGTAARQWAPRCTETGPRGSWPPRCRPRPRAGAARPCARAALARPISISWPAGASSGSWVLTSVSPVSPIVAACRRSQAARCCLRPAPSPPPAVVVGALSGCCVDACIAGHEDMRRCRSASVRIADFVQGPPLFTRRDRLRGVALLPVSAEPAYG